MQKKGFILLLAAALCVGMTACGKTTESTAQTESETSDTKPQNFPNDEIGRASAYGFVPQEWHSDWERQITSGEFLDALGRVVELADPEDSANWQEVSDSAVKDVPMNVAEGRVAVYVAACAMGIGNTTNGNWNYIDEHGQIGGWTFEPTETIFSFQEEGSPFCDQRMLGYERCPGWDYMTAARLWCYGQFSQVSGKNIFDYNRNSSETENVPLTAEMAARALTRFYESTLLPVQTESTDKEEVQKLLVEADQRKNAILESDTELVSSDEWVQGETYSGTAYYVSQDGNDANNGTSEESSWATLEQVNRADLKPGDAVFFRRGDIWYGQLWGQAGVTYSAYGTGEKPMLSGAEQKGSDASMWQLYQEGADGAKIWRYMEELGDVTGIFFDNNEQYAKKAMPCWDGENYVHEDGTVFTAEGLKEDLTFFSAVDLTGLGDVPYVEDSGRKGILYLRCDAGNPGEVFEDVQIGTYFCGFSPVEDESGCTVDNLSFYYYGLAVSCGGYQGASGALIQNCEIGYGGGIMQSYRDDRGSGIAYPWTSGGAVHIAGSDQTARKNYIHDCASKVFVLANHYQEGMDLLYQNDVMEENLIEHCSAALHLVDYVGGDTGEEKQGSFDNIVFRDNMILYAGYGWFEEEQKAVDYIMEKSTECSIEFGGVGYENPGSQGVFIQDNLFCLAKHALIQCYVPESIFPVFERNTYVQNTNGWLAEIRGYMLSITEGAEEWGEQYLHDTEGKFYTWESEQ